MLHAVLHYLFGRLIRLNSLTIVQETYGSLVLGLPLTVGINQLSQRRLPFDLKIDFIGVLKMKLNFVFKRSAYLIDYFQ
jgi:hypothetical protein